MQAQNNTSEVEDLVNLPETKLLDTTSENTLNPQCFPVDAEKEEADDASETVKTSEDNGNEGEFVLPVLVRGTLEEQGVCKKRTSSPLSDPTNLEASHHLDEDVTAESWRQHRKHVFVLSEAGKPIYSRYGSEEALSSTMGVMMALVSFIQSGDNVIRSVYSGEVN